MKVTEALLGEHGTLKALLEHLETTIQTTESLEHIQSLSSLLASALESHASIENEILFPALEKVLGRDGPLEVMHHEHDEIAATFRSVLTCDDVARARSLVRHVLQVAREHFEKEEVVLFPMAERALDGAALDRLGNEWAQVRKVQALPG